ncbi:hypothetical protein Q6348_02310 [Isoptericola sp. b441]|uniref:Uncharacterized protein n=1 Tax=Actinotalea lenta TaxID=3064654 RepID=A0ABT9D5H0_9CELL|nr:MULTISPECIES: hypothetical protein [unclassified Isoptericola]MDO8106025.1 hypothetical protein [Isoptericola sp. b441]MDO8122256.1 hypothetical protein [Isoptericola sp. b490]
MHVFASIPVDPSTYVSWGWLSISVPNLIMVGITVALFVLALVLPFPAGRGGIVSPTSGGPRTDADPPTGDHAAAAEPPPGDGTPAVTRTSDEPTGDRR